MCPTYPMRLDGNSCIPARSESQYVSDLQASVKKSRIGWDLDKFGAGSAMSLPLFARRYPLSAPVGTACGCFDENLSVYFFQER